MSSNTRLKDMDDKSLIFKNTKSRDYSLGIDLLNDSDEDFFEFIRNRIKVYGVHKNRGEDLWWNFFDDLKEFTKAENFLRAGTELPRLRDVLRKRGNPKEN
ncbi:hypothetical protein GcM3_045030 [Golovinomyces cichoracearum]|uniref:Uncharacterized protein n=1 Tax=Golovinomyces cichoracearum TaxID=62708 RepID=A0A420J100_9PEZI|nr:hypothetical protein GcM3_045030 [Golovinomyces cichoracearum]